MKAELPFGLLRSGKDSQEEPELTECAVVSEFECLDSQGPDFEDKNVMPELLQFLA